jgi:hypothetical protein
VCVCVCVCVCVRSLCVYMQECLHLYIEIFPQSLLHFLKKIIYIYITIAVFRHTRRGHQIPLQMVVSHHVVAGN